MKAIHIIRRPFRYAFWNVSLILIGINLLVYVLTMVFPQIAQYLALNVIYVVKGNMYWQFITYMFVHGNLLHLIFNMLGILFFGVTVERRLGSKEFLLLYLLCGLFCGAFSFCVYYFTGAWTVFLLGASGAIYAILLSYAVMFPRSVIYIWGVIPVLAPVLILIYAVIEIVSQLFNSRSAVAHLTHLAGFGAAWLYFLIRMQINPWKVWTKK